jgi:hypothetical protein
MPTALRVENTGGGGGGIVGAVLGVLGLASRPSSNVWGTAAVPGYNQYIANLVGQPFRGAVPDVASPGQPPTAAPPPAIATPAPPTGAGSGEPAIPALPPATPIGPIGIVGPVAPSAPTPLALPPPPPRDPYIGERYGRPLPRIDPPPGGFRPAPSALFGLGSIALLALGLLFPRSTASDDELTEEQRREALDRYRRENPLRTASGEIARVAPSQVPSVGGPVLEQIAVSAKRLPTGAPKLEASVRPPQIAQATRAPGPAAIPQNAVSPPARGQRVAQRIQSATSNPAAQLALLALNLITPSSARSKATVPQAYGQPQLVPAAPPGSGSAPRVQVFPYPVRDGGQDQCDCKQKRRSERRKCKERADVVYSTGRRKGQKAGTKCVVYHS